MKLFQNPIFVVLLCLLASCKEEYQPKVKSSEQSVLVVEGILNSGNAPTTIKLTRTLNLSDTTKVQPETGARLAVESKSGSAIPLVDSGDGSYRADQLSLDPTEEYRLHIYTSDGSEYASDYLSVHKNPSIDSVNWTRDSAGVTIYVNTHDPQNNTHYYRWEFDETWEIHSSYFAYPIPDDGIMEPIYPGEDIYHCWKSYNSSNLILGSTTQLSSDVVFEKSLIKIKDGDDRLSVRYTALVRQYALDTAGYAFYQLMKKNTESIGSIFDAQPTEITGNVHSLSGKNTPVIGYIMASTVDTARLWITKEQVPNWPLWADCSYHMRVTDPSSFTAAHEWLVYSSDPSGSWIAQAACVSCRLRGGSTHKPAWW